MKKNVIVIQDKHAYTCIWISSIVFLPANGKFGIEAIF